MAVRLGAFENRAFTAEEHHEWSLKLWSRMDRDNSGSITKEELNCDEFQDVLRSVISPANTGAECRAAYGRAEIHIDQALDFCLRKATLNKDGTLSFKEFKSFMRTLRNQGDEGSRVHLIFALFDLDGSNTIDKEEFQGIYSMLCGRNPTKAEVTLAFEQMDKFDKKEVTKKQFINWLKTEAPPEFKQHAAGVEEDDQPAEEESSSKKTKVKKIHRPAPGMWIPKPDHIETWTQQWHVHWNERFRGRDHALMNPTCPERMRHYFSAPQTLPELDRFYNTYKGFGRHRKALHKYEPPKPRPVLSTQSNIMEVNPERARAGGTARNSKGDLILWDNNWHLENNKRKAPGTLLLRCPGKPPPMLLFGRDADHAAYRAALDHAARRTF